MILTQVVLAVLAAILGLVVIYYLGTEILKQAKHLEIYLSSKLQPYIKEKYKANFAAGLMVAIIIVLSAAISIDAILLLILR